MKYVLMNYENSNKYAEKSVGINYPWRLVKYKICTKMTSIFGLLEDKNHTKYPTQKMKAQNTMAVIFSQ